MTEHKEGRSWNIVARMGTFEAADARRAQLQDDPELQVKIHWMRKPPSKFAVKTRLTEEAFSRYDRRPSNNKKNKSKGKRESKN
jgi:hypothetical protein